MKSRALKSELWRPKYRDKKSGEIKESAIWWIRYRVRGEDLKISTHTSDYNAAFALLQRKKSEVTQGIRQDRDSERVKVAALLDILIFDYKKHERATANDAESRIESHLRPFFGHFRAADLTTDDIERYQSRRKKQEAQNATINRELAILRRAFHLAARRTPPLVEAPPFFAMLPVDNVREGFLSWDVYRALRDALPSRVKLLFIMAFHVGCRRGELLKLEWPQIDFERRELRLKKSTTKNRTPRTLPFYGDMESYLLAARENRHDDEVAIFVEDDGSPLGAFRKSWATACKKVGVGELLFHDLRRTAVRNMMDAGIPQSHAMYISGHKTDSIFRRYDIVSDDRLAAASAKMQSLFDEKLNDGPGGAARVKKVAKSDAKSTKDLAMIDSK
jgi:integrase